MKTVLLIALCLSMYVSTSLMQHRELSLQVEEALILLSLFSPKSRFIFCIINTNENNKHPWHTHTYFILVGPTATGPNSNIDLHVCVCVFLCVCLGYIP